MRDTTVYIIAVAVVVMSAIIGVTTYHINDRNLMSKNMDAAIAKGVDPLSVRCAFANSGDTICVAYGAGRK